MLMADWSRVGEKGPTEDRGDPIEDDVVVRTSHGIAVIPRSGGSNCADFLEEDERDE